MRKMKRLFTRFNCARIDSFLCGSFSNMFTVVTRVIRSFSIVKEGIISLLCMLFF